MKAETRISKLLSEVRIRHDLMLGQFEKMELGFDKMIICLDKFEKQQSRTNLEISELRLLIKLIEDKLNIANEHQ